VTSPDGAAVELWNITWGAGLLYYRDMSKYLLLAYLYVKLMRRSTLLDLQTHWSYSYGSYITKKYYCGHDFWWLWEAAIL